MKRLYTPFKVNKLELKNRVIMSPMSIGHTVDGFIMDDVVEFYKRRAQGGVRSCSSKELANIPTRPMLSAAARR